MKCLILNFFLLILKILLNLISDDIYKQFKVSKILLEKSFKFNQAQKNFGSGGLVFSMYVLVLIKTNLIIKKQNYK